MNTKVKFKTFIDELGGVSQSPPSPFIVFSDEEGPFDAYYYLCKAKKEDTDWIIVHNGTGGELFQEALKNHCEKSMSDGAYVAYSIETYGLDFNSLSITPIKKHCYLELKPKKKEPKVFINGPKKNTEFLAKKGKHYVSSNNHAA